MARIKVVKIASGETVLFNIAITEPTWHSKQPHFIQNKIGSASCKERK